MAFTVREVEAPAVQVAGLALLAVEDLNILAASSVHELGRSVGVGYFAAIEPVFELFCFLLLSHSNLDWASFFLYTMDVTIAIERPTGYCVAGFPQRRDGLFFVCIKNE